jgi:hypothetical protein
VVAELAILAGLLGLVTTAARRIAPWVGDRRYLAIAIAAPLALGLPALWLGGAELAWIWLVPAAAAALAPRLGRLGPLALAFTVLPGVLVLLPNQLREAAWNGFLPSAVPLAIWVAGLAVSPVAALAWWLRKTPTAGPLGTLVLPMGSALAMIAGAVALGRAAPPCNALEFRQLSLACECVAPVR